MSRRWISSTAGFELPLLYVTGAAALAFAGPGSFSLDNALGLDGMAGTGWGLAAVVVGALSGLAVVARARRTLDADADQVVTGEHVPA